MSKKTTISDTEADRIAVQYVQMEQFRQRPEKKVVKQVLIEEHADGDITVSGNIVGGKNRILALIDQAREEIAAHYDKLEAGKHVIIPQHQTSIPHPRHYTLTCDTADFSHELSNIRS